DDARMRWITVAAVLVAGCAASRPSPAPSNAAVTASARSWRAGVGVDGCKLGNAVADCERTLGPGTRDGDYATFAPVGVQVRVEGDRVSVVFVMYRSKDARPFAGADEHGIGANATVDEVLAAYGTPSRVGDSVVSEYGEFP